MKKQISLSLLVILLGMVCSCNKKPKEMPAATPQVPVDRTISRIDAVFYNYLIDIDDAQSQTVLQNADVPDFEHSAKGRLDASVIASKYLMQIDTLISNLHPSEVQQPVDARIRLTVVRGEAAADTICIGGRYATRIYLNGKLQQPDNRLLFLLKNQIGYYPWFIGDAMTHMSELTDDSFMKSPFVFTAYYKQYQNSLNKTR